MKRFFLIALLMAGFATSRAQLLRHSHFYCFFEELGAGKDGFTNEGISCYVLKQAEHQTVPIFRYYNGHDHFYTNNAAELADGKSGYWFEEVQFYAFPFQVEGTVPLYRAMGPEGHFYTTDINEINRPRSGVHLENIMCYVYPTQVEGTAPLYRYFFNGNGYR